MDQTAQKRWAELAERAFSRCCYTYTEFLSLAEQDSLSRFPLGKNAAPLHFWGGFPEAERKLACFGSPELCGYEEEPPLCYIEIKARQARFAEQLSHRDFLGALLSLGLRRSLLGDILIYENRGYLICFAHMGSFILEQLQQVRRTSVFCSLVDVLPDVSLLLPEPQGFQVASERLDALLAAVYHLSRSESQLLVSRGRAAVNDRECLSGDTLLQQGDRVSLRGYGRFLYEGAVGSTRKGRLRVSARVF
ncbi:MAG: YlmH/Sll1252 family protein [Bacillota bacterium]|nr:YlmH/Sll1252 family protein [Bacillota bacterium]